MTIDRIKEQYLSYFIGILVMFLNYLFEFSLRIDMAVFSEKSIDISSISFGFLLAVLALLLQSQTDALQRIKDNGKFSELINFNKKAVVASAVLAIFSLIYLILKVPTDFNCVMVQSISLRLVFDCLFLAVFTYQVVVVYLFLDLFYFLIK